ncbi:MAG: RIP metalloprotease RseP [Alphaproteobacteria bacterium PRO2]|nr:RIP metalloprotease RseP [Alphaproteobacteria bacterium PRO2]
MNIFELFHMLGSNVWIYGGTFLLVLSILVFVHEWGHYIAAKLCGVKVEVFSIGFGKELFGFNDKSGTRWKMCLVPLGGYVKLFGDVDPASVKHVDGVADPASGAVRPLTVEERRAAFFAKPVWQRAIIVAAGPGINYLFAFILLTLLFTFNGQPTTPPVGAGVIGGSSADRYGFRPHDEVVSIDGRAIRDFEDIRREMTISLDQERVFKVRRNGEIVTIKARPEKKEMQDRFGFKHSRGMLGLISARHAVDIKNIQTINGKTYDDAEQVRAALLAKMGTTFKVQVQNGSALDELTVRPSLEFNKSLETADPDDPKSTLLLVTNMDISRSVMKFSPLEAVGEALNQTWDVTLGTLEALGQMIMGTRSTTELGGVIRIGALAGDMAQQGIIALIFFTALLSINLGLVNLFPIPVLDGGHLVFYAFEAILGRPVPDRIQEYAFQFGLTFLVCIMVYANLSDIMQLIL